MSFGVFAAWVLAEKMWVVCLGLTVEKVWTSGKNDLIQEGLTKSKLINYLIGLL